MHIAFKFEYIHDNGLFTRLLKRIEESSDTSLRLYSEGHTYTIEASGDQPTLETLAEQISSLVPQSLFLKDYKIEAVDKEEDEEKVVLQLLDASTPFKVPYCPECQEHVVSSLNPFNPCNVCGFSGTSLSLKELISVTNIVASTAETFFNQAAEVLIKQGEITLPTYNGVRHFSLLDEKTVELEGVLYCNPTELSKNFLITQGELDALMMVEKPSIRLKPKLMFRVEQELEDPFYPLFFPDDKITLAFSIALKNKGIDAVFSDKIPTLRVASALEEHLIIKQGRDMLPCHVSMRLKNPSFCAYDAFQAFGNSHGLHVDRNIDLKDKPFIRYVANSEKIQEKNAISFESAHAAQRSVVVEHQLEGKSLCGIHLSRAYQSHIFSFSKKIGYTPMVLFRDEDIIQQRDMLRAIEGMDEGGTRLVQNFKNAFPELYEKIERQQFIHHTDISDVTKVWAMAASFIGLYEGDDAMKSCEVLEATAIEFGGKSGPRIDYKVIATEEGYQLDSRLAIRSAMSFKLAGLDDYLLSFGFIDSLADFLAQQAEDADANIGTEGVTLSGGLFENRQLLMRTYNALSVNYPIYRNERLSVDGANVTLGAITLGSEV
ncbi:MAG: Protein hydE [uncultured Sulfurovum sp.]|uniref:Protein hydE n=1 Tax=uncultured Sulfurovum sp. TaxID=269237 RepID=A0A6S6SGY5_9BACT|nr:MAG: Protein hydE [uncultured Sulfurovum sp.]